jgi:acyl-CoA thioesterase
MHSDETDRSRRFEETTGPHRVQMESWISCAPFEKHLQMEILEAKDGNAVLTMPFFLQLAQGGGLMHGGALASLADTAVVMAIKSILPPQTHFATISMQSKFLYPVKEGVVTARARVEPFEERTLQGSATVFNQEERAVMEFISVFKIARDAQIRGVTFAS